MWVIDYLDDIESDMSVFHRISDMYAMPPVKFFRFALRLPAYKGVMRSRIEAEEAKKSKRGKRLGSDGPVRETTYNDPAVAHYFDEG